MIPLFERAHAALVLSSAKHEVERAGPRRWGLFAGGDYDIYGHKNRVARTAELILCAKHEMNILSRYGRTMVARGAAKELQSAD